MKYNQSMFESIKESLNKKSATDNTAFKDILKLEKEKTYIVRLVPNVEDFEKTFFHYYSHTWQSRLDQSWQNVFCPNSYGERCPIDEFRGKIWKSKDEAAKEETKPLARSESWMVNVYVIKDPTNPENQGQIKTLRYGKQLNKIITTAMSGDEADEFGPKIFDLSPAGCNLKIKVETNEGGYATYVASKFMSASAIEGLTDIDAAYEQVKTFDSMFKQISYDEIKAILDKHWHGTVGAAPVIDEEEDAEPMPTPTPTPKTSKKKAHEEESVTEMAGKDKEIDDLIKDL